MAHNEQTTLLILDLKIKLIGMSSNCKTEHGPPCVFPFTYRGKKYDSCSAKYGQKTWCSTKTYNGNYIRGHWGYCNKDCSEKSNSITTKTTTTTTTTTTPKTTTTTPKTTTTTTPKTTTTTTKTTTTTTKKTTTTTKKTTTTTTKRTTTTTKTTTTTTTTTTTR